jgi:hypothetical protein
LTTTNIAEAMKDAHWISKDLSEVSEAALDW